MDLTATVKVNELQSTTREEGNKLEREQKAAMPKTRKRMGGSAVQRQKEVRTEINILGQTVDEATVSVGRFIDQALLGGVNQVRIIHGKGTGALREGVHQYLRTLPHVAHFETAGYDEGGAGATNVVLKVTNKSLVQYNNKIVFRMVFEYGIKGSKFKRTYYLLDVAISELTVFFLDFCSFR